jgi:hypothetical protein
MQKNPIDLLLLETFVLIKQISNDRVAECQQMDSDLMRAAG